MQHLLQEIDHFLLDQINFLPDHDGDLFDLNDLPQEIDHFLLDQINFL